MYVRLIAMCKLTFRFVAPFVARPEDRKYGSYNAKKASLHDNDNDETESEILLLWSTRNPFSQRPITAILHAK